MKGNNWSYIFNVKEFNESEIFKSPLFIMIKLRWLTICLILVMSACRKDVELTKADYTGNQLKLGGYYAGPRNGEGLDYFFFYRNGVLLYAGGYSDPMDVGIIEDVFRSDEFDESKKKVKYVWGVFNIAGNVIEFEKWEPGGGKALKTVGWSGDILNDSTFLVTSFIGTKGDAFVVNDTFNLRPFSPKPDSTNMFIK